jgi:integrase
MPRKVKDRNLDSREARQKLKVRGVPYYRSLDKRLHLGYRRLKGKAGTWWARHYIGDQQYEVEPIGVADDLSDADGKEVFDFWQAQDRARAAMARRAKLGAAGTSDDGQVITVNLALYRYRANLEARGADVGNVGRIRPHLTEALGDRQLALLTAHSLESWRNGLLKKMAPASVNRVCNALRAALNHSAKGIEGLNRQAWKDGLNAIPGASEARNVVISDAEVRRVVLEASKASPEFGLFVEVAAVTGARPSQLGRAQVRDLKADSIDMPSSKKGRSLRKVSRRQVPIPATLADRLRIATAGKALDAPLLTKPHGSAWSKGDHARPFQKVAAAAGLDPASVTIYSLRHSSITRQLKANVPIRVIAALHDTSVPMIEANYSLSIDKHVDQIVRPALLDFDPAPADRSNVRPLAARR